MGLSQTDHVLLFPFPAKGHINPFLCLAQLLCNAGIQVTFLNTEHYHRRIHNLTHLATQFPSLHFESISDGLPPDQPQNLLDGKLLVSMREVTKPLFRELLVSYSNGTSPTWPPITCVITDVVFRFPMDVAEELGIPVFSFSTFSARFLFLFFSIPQLLEDGQLPHPDGNVNQQLHGVPGAEGLLRCKDLPGFWSVEAVEKRDPMNFVSQILATSRSSGLILNTFEELEAPFLASLSNIYKKIYTIGPIHSLLKNSQSDRERGLWKEDDSCLAWLDSQPRRSVLFVSFGSLVKIKSGELVELWNGLVNSGKSFLMVLRSDAIKEEGEDEKQRQRVREIMEKMEAGEQKWRIVNWAPQEEVLSHEAICGFLTHSGWNSTLESLAAGVPMISWPHIGDQPSNCTWLTKVWKIGLQMEDSCHRSTVEATIRSIMEEQGEERNNIAKLAKRAKDRVSKEGTSYRNLRSLVEDIKNIKLKTS